MRISFPSHKFYGAFRFGSKSRAKILIIFENYEIKTEDFSTPLRCGRNDERKKIAAVEMTDRKKLSTLN